MGIFKKRGNQYEIKEWYVGWHSWKFEITYRNHGYDYSNAELHISMFGWHSLFRLPWKHKNIDMWREEKTYGMSIHDNTVFFNWGYNLKGWDLPFVSCGGCVRWVRYNGSSDAYFYDSMLTASWETHPYKMKYEGGCQNPTTWEYDYTDPYDGAVVPCKFWVEEMEWRPKWLKWTKAFAKTRRYIEVEFSQEMGPRKGSWKGGTLGCGYELLSGEHPTDCIKRMEREYKFS